jgi:hypothetical protein
MPTYLNEIKTETWRGKWTVESSNNNAYYIEKTTGRNDSEIVYYCGANTPTADYEICDNGGGSGTIQYRFWGRPGDGYTLFLPRYSLMLLESQRDRSTNNRSYFTVLLNLNSYDSEYPEILLTGYEENNGSITCSNYRNVGRKQITAKDGASNKWYEYQDNNGTIVNLNPGHVYNKMTKSYWFGNTNYSCRQHNPACQLTYGPGMTNGNFRYTRVITLSELPSIEDVLQINGRTVGWDSFFSNGNGPDTGLKKWLNFATIKSRLTNIWTNNQAVTIWGYSTWKEFYLTMIYNNLNSSNAIQNFITTNCDLTKMQSINSSDYPYCSRSNYPSGDNQTKFDSLSVTFFQNSCDPSKNNNNDKIFSDQTCKDYCTQNTSQTLLCNNYKTDWLDTKCTNKGTYVIRTEVIDSINNLNSEQNCYKYCDWKNPNHNYFPNYNITNETTKILNCQKIIEPTIRDTCQVINELKNKSACDDFYNNKQTSSYNINIDPYADDNDTIINSNHKQIYKFCNHFGFDNTYFKDNSKFNQTWKTSISYNFYTDELKNFKLLCQVYNLSDDIFNKCQNYINQIASTTSKNTLNEVLFSSDFANEVSKNIYENSMFYNEIGKESIYNYISTGTTPVDKINRALEYGLIENFDTTIINYYNNLLDDTLKKNIRNNNSWIKTLDAYISPINLIDDTKPFTLPQVKNFFETCSTKIPIELRSIQIYNNGKILYNLISDNAFINIVNNPINNSAQEIDDKPAEYAINPDSTTLSIKPENENNYGVYYSKNGHYIVILQIKNQKYIIRMFYNFLMTYEYLLYSCNKILLSTVPENNRIFRIKTNNETIAPIPDQTLDKSLYLFSKICDYAKNTYYRCICTNDKTQTYIQDNFFSANTPQLLQATLLDLGSCILKQCNDTNTKNKTIIDVSPSRNEVCNWPNITICSININNAGILSVGGNFTIEQNCDGGNGEGSIKCGPTNGNVKCPLGYACANGLCMKTCNSTSECSTSGTNKSICTEVSDLILDDGLFFDNPTLGPYLGKTICVKEKECNTSDKCAKATYTVDNFSSTVCDSCGVDENCVQDTLNNTYKCCKRNCTNLTECGNDGCGGTCGECQSNEICNASRLCECVPNCTGKTCGDNGCGGICGSCTSGNICTNGQCVCVPNCTGKECGTDGCGGTCGSCGANQKCTNDGKCVNETCVLSNGVCGDIDPNCGNIISGNYGDADCKSKNGQNYYCDSNGSCKCTKNCTAQNQCGSDGCGGNCGVCSGGKTCNEVTKECICVPNCTGKTCGSDGCGGTCGTCTTGKTCTNGQCVCAPNCTGKTCGSDGCGGTCGTCTTGKTCTNGQCVCAPNCTGKECGTDGCTGICGTCTTGKTCTNGQCVCAPNCTGKECGTDGCTGTCGSCNSGEECSNGICIEKQNNNTLITVGIVIFFIFFIISIGYGAYLYFYNTND